MKSNSFQYKLQEGLYMGGGGRAYNNIACIFLFTGRWACDWGAY